MLLIFEFIGRFVIHSAGRPIPSKTKSEYSTVNNAAL